MVALNLLIFFGFFYDHDLVDTPFTSDCHAGNVNSTIIKTLADIESRKLQVRVKSSWHWGGGGSHLVVLVMNDCRSSSYCSSGCHMVLVHYCCGGHCSGSNMVLVNNSCRCHSGCYMVLVYHCCGCHSGCHSGCHVVLVCP